LKDILIISQGSPNSKAAKLPVAKEMIIILAGACIRVHFFYNSFFQLKVGAAQARPGYLSAKLRGKSIPWTGFSPGLLLYH
jgi:hypothetical protein